MRGARRRGRVDTKASGSWCLEVAGQASKFSGNQQEIRKVGDRQQIIAFV